MKRRTKYALWAVGGLLALWAYLFVLVYFESQSPDANIEHIGDAWWFAIITLSTVGYGDFYPITTGGRIMSLVLVIGSVGVLTYVISSISLVISKYMKDQKEGRYGTSFRNHFVIVGWDSFSRQVATQIVRSGHKVAIVTDQQNDVELIHQAFDRDTAFVLFADFSDQEALKKAGIEHCSKVFVNFPDDSKSLIYILNAQKAYPNLDFVVMLDSQELKDTFRGIGVTYIVSKNEIASKLVASYMFEPDAALLAEDLMETSQDDREQDIFQFKVTAQNPFVNKEYMEGFVGLKERYNGILLGLSKTTEVGTKLLKNPEEKCSIDAGDYLIVMSNGPSKERMQTDFGVAEGRLAE